MEDKFKNKAQLSKELAEMREEMAEMKQLLSQREQVVRSLQDSQNRFANILDLANEGIISVDESQRIILFNKGAERIFGYEVQEVMWQSLDILIPPRFRESHKEHIIEFDNDDTNTRWMEERSEIVGLRKNGEEFPIEASISKLEMEQNKFFTVVLRDITHRKEAEAEREKLIEELSAFAHSVAHDLKNPLSSIMNYANILTMAFKNLPPEKSAKYLKGLVHDVRKMSNIIDELLLLAGVRETEVEMQPLEMSQIVEEAQSRLTHLLDEFEGEIVMPNDWPTARGHGPWVEEIWVNYLSNAIKYGGRPPKIELGATTSDGFVKFWIRDNGPGLTPEDQAKLFTPFTQLKQAQLEGQGLGLSIVRRIVEKLEGEVGIESEGIEGKGCTFTFTLPKV